VAVASLVHGVPNVGLRFFNIYGPRQDPRSPYSGLISIFANQIARDEYIVFYAMALKRGILFTSVMLFNRCACDVDRGTAGGYEVFDVCTGNPTSMLDLAATTGSLVATQVKSEHQPARNGDTCHSCGVPSDLLENLRNPTRLKFGLERQWGGMMPITGNDIRALGTPRKNTVSYIWNFSIMLGKKSNGVGRRLRQVKLYLIERNRLCLKP
jgi:nucleoside-diphosphate-sugar epimerase